MITRFGVHGILTVSLAMVVLGDTKTNPFGTGIVGVRLGQLHLVVPEFVYMITSTHSSTVLHAAKSATMVSAAFLADAIPMLFTG